MARRPGSTAEREARDRARDRYDAEVKAVAAYFGLEDQVAKLRDKISVIEAQQAEVVADLAADSGAARAAATVGWPVSRVREAMTSRSSEASGSS